MSTVTKLANEWRININYLPPYMLVFNLIEYYFNTTRQYVKIEELKDKKELCRNSNRY